VAPWLPGQLLRIVSVSAAGSRLAPGGCIMTTASGNPAAPLPPGTPMATFLTFVLFPLFLIVAVTLWVTESRQQRIRRWVASGISQREAARRLGISRYQVAKVLAA
jgi:DNA-binding NarL/FixJ family response regulator